MPKSTPTTNSAAKAGQTNKKKPTGPGKTSGKVEPRSLTPTPVKSKLAFRSLRTRSLDPTCPPVVVETAPKEPNQQSSPAIAVVTSLTPKAAGDPNPIVSKRTWSTRANREKNDIEISASGVLHNVARITEIIRQDGGRFQRRHVRADYDVAKELNRSTLEEKKKFWQSNFVAINVDLTTANDNERGLEDEIIKVIKSLGPDFAANVRKVFITITLPQAKNATMFGAPGSYRIADIEMTTPSYASIKNLVDIVKTFSSLQRLDVILNTSKTDGPLTAENLVYGLPFYKLTHFSHWSLKWKTATKKTPEIIRGQAIKFLDKCNGNVHRREDQEKKTAHYETTFITYSAFDAKELEQE